jgi:hypothetical protein
MGGDHGGRAGPLATSEAKPVTSYRCVGALHGPVGDCLVPIAGALLCYGYLDRDHQLPDHYARPLEDALEGPRPLLFFACNRHKAPLVQWAEHLWGQVADGTWIPPEAISPALRFFDMEEDPVVVSPDPMAAVAIA